MRSTDTEVSDTFAGSDGNWTVTITGAADETVWAAAWSSWLSGTPPTEPTGDDGKQVNGCITARDDAVLTGAALLGEATAVTDAGAPAVPWACWVAHAATGTVSAMRKQERNLTSIGPRALVER